MKAQVSSSTFSNSVGEINQHHLVVNHKDQQVAIPINQVWRLETLPASDLEGFREKVFVNLFWIAFFVPLYCLYMFSISPDDYFHQFFILCLCIAGAYPHIKVIAFCLSRCFLVIHDLEGKRFIVLTKDANREDIVAISNFFDTPMPFHFFPRPKGFPSFKYATFFTMVENFDISMAIIDNWNGYDPVYGNV
jgi:hypothetical protein